MRRKSTFKVGSRGIIPARNRNRLVISPVTNNTTFYVIPALSSGAINLPSAPVVLKEGEHRDIHSGFGVWHAWHGHFSHCSDYEQAEKEVATFVSSALVPGAEFFWQQDKRCAVLQNQARLVILDGLLDGSNNFYYSVITAYNKAQSRGTRLGAL